MKSRNTGRDGHSSLREIFATTKTRTIKDLEIAEFYRAFKQTSVFSKPGCAVLEVGCGNGHNCFGLSQLIPHFKFTGVDFVAEMIANANKIKCSDDRYQEIDFLEGNILELEENTFLASDFDIVFSNQCIINLNTIDLQKEALDQLIAKTSLGGYVVLIENIKQTYEQQNKLRKLAGLAERTPDKFNLFIDEPAFLEHARKQLTLVECKDFASLHDIVLYVLVPMINDGNTDYEHPLVRATAQLLMANESELSGQFGAFGQNRLYVFKRDPSR